jgi:hypothetical protein
MAGIIQVVTAGLLGWMLCQRLKTLSGSSAALMVASRS